MLVVGDAGVGKSRLLFELESWIELRPEPVWLLQGRALRSRQGVAHGLVRDVLAQRFGVLDSDAPPRSSAKLRAGFARLAGRPPRPTSSASGWGSTWAVGAGPLVAEGVAVTARAHLVRWLGALAADEPAVVLLEDLHWADDESLELVAELVARLADARAARGRAGPARAGRSAPRVVRRTGDDDPDRCSRRSRRRRPLSWSDGVLQHADVVPDDLVELIVGRCDGNPFFVEELVEDAHRRSASSEPTGPTAAGRSTSTGSRGSPVPATLTGVLQVRLDHLAPHELVALQCASIVGRVFWDASVAALDDRGEPTSRFAPRWTCVPRPRDRLPPTTSPCSPAATS